MDGGSEINLNQLFKQPVYLTEDGVEHLKIEGGFLHKILWVVQTDYSIQKTFIEDFAKRVLTNSKMIRQDIGIIRIPANKKFSAFDIVKQFQPKALVVFCLNSNLTNENYSLSNVEVNTINEVQVLFMESILEADKKEKKILFWNAWQKLLSSINHS